ncbi:MAG: hypothetical protein ACON4B_05415 [Flavobacteriaceae bacterium]
MTLNNLPKYQKLIVSIIGDLLGYVSFIVPIFDVVWAPLSGYIMSKLYDGKKGKIAGVLVFIEEALPFLDVLPSFLILWIYTYYFDQE